MKNTSIDIAKLEEEKILVQGRNFEINQRLMRIVKSRDAPFADYVGQILSEKPKPVFEKLKEIQKVTKSRAALQQGGEKEVNINNSYQTDPKETKEAYSIRLEKKTSAEKYKNMKEVKTGWKDHVSLGSGKGNVNIISRKGTEEDLTLTRKEKVEREKRVKELDELNALRKKLDAEETGARNSEMILENKKALFPAWTLERV